MNRPFARRLRATVFALAALPAFAQDRSGADTPGEWVVTHQAHFDLWDSVCDERPGAGAPERRCYIRYVDVFSPRPEFAAHFLFVTPAADGLRIEYGSEPGTRFAPSGHRIERDGRTVWKAVRSGCLTGGACDFTGTAADELFAAMRAGGAWRFVFSDRHGRLRDLSWDLAPFAAAAADFEAEAAARGLR